jgi:hypothetical protein
VTAPTETLQTSLWVIVLDQLAVCLMPPTSETNLHVRLSLEVSYVPGMAPLLRDDPTCAVVEVDAHHCAPSLASPSAARLDQGVTGQHTNPGKQLHRRLEEISLHQQNALPASCATRVHDPSTPTSRTHVDAEDCRMSGSRATTYLDIGASRRP